jgi:iron complex outermembrane receptor protein
MDGAYNSSSTSGMNLYDVERVEVLRGPQGTLYGRNATGGSINVISAKPTEDFTSYVNVTAGGPDLNIASEAAISGSLTDQIQGRVAMRYEKRDGYGEHTGSGEDIDDSNKRALRTQLNFDLSDTVSNLVSFEYYEDDERSRTLKFIEPSFSQATIDALATDPQALAAVGGDQALLDSLLANNLPSLATDAPVNSRDVGGSQIPVGQLKTTSFTNTFDWQVNELVSLRSLTNYREGENTLIQDFDVSNAESDPSTVQLQYVENEQLSQELQLSFEGQRFNGIIGAFYFDETQKSAVPIGTDPEAVFDALGNSVDRSFSTSLIDGVAAADPSAQPILGDFYPSARVIIPGLMNVEAYALFANFSFDITDSMRLKLGARQSEEERDILVETRIPVAAGGLGVTISRVEDERSYSAFTPEVGVEFDVGETLVYAGYSEGFKSGVAALVDSSPELIAPEEIVNYEVGAKGSYLDGRLNLSSAAFYYEIDNVQYDRTFLIAGGPRFSSSVENAGATTGQGLEIEGAFQANADFRVDFNATWYDITFDNFNTTNPLEPYGALQGLSGQPVDQVDLSGNRVRNTPEYSVGLRGTYTHALQGGSEVDFAMGYAYKGDQYFTEFNDERMSSDAYGILDANVKYVSPDGSWSVNLWGKNLTDEFVQSGAFAISTSRTIAGTYLPPRQYGVTIGYDF